jgi:hypothetical protein
LRIAPRKWERTVDQLKGFDLDAHETLAYGRTLGPAEVIDLLRMTPNYWHLEEGALVTITEWDPVQVTVGVDLLCFRRRGADAA